MVILLVVMFSRKTFYVSVIIIIIFFVKCITVNRYFKFIKIYKIRVNIYILFIQY